MPSNRRSDDNEQPFSRRRRNALARRSRQRRSALGGLGAVAAVAAVVIGYATLSGGGDGSRPDLAERAAPTTTAVQPTVSTTPAIATLGPGVNYVATANGAQIDMFDDPDAPAPAVTLPNPWLLNDDADKPIPQVFLVERVRDDGWLEVLSPERPNGNKKWIRAADVTIAKIGYAIKVSLSARQITVTQDGQTIYEGPVAVGSETPLPDTGIPTPTPTGKYYIRVLLRTDNPSSPYGPYAYGLSAHSDSLSEFSGGDAEIGIHGNNDSSALGRAVSHGCIRMDNAEITELAGVLPLGTPVEIVA